MNTLETIIKAKIDVEKVQEIISVDLNTGFKDKVIWCDHSDVYGRRKVSIWYYNKGPSRAATFEKKGPIWKWVDEGLFTKEQLNHIEKVFLYEA